MRAQIFLLTTLFFTLISCHQGKKEKKLSKPERTTPYVQPDTFTTGTWHYSFPFYSSKLILKGDGTFQHLSRGCTGHTYSEGCWTKKGFAISLKSNDPYKEDTQSKNILLRTDKKKQAKEDTNSTDLAYYTSESTLKIKVPDFNFSDYTITAASFTPDTLYTYFDHDLYLPVGDTLYKLDKKGNKTSIRFTK